MTPIRPPPPPVAARLAFLCARCGAEPGQWCTTPGGWRSTQLHAARARAWRQQQRTRILTGMTDVPLPEQDQGAIEPVVPPGCPNCPGPGVVHQHGAGR